MKGEPTNESVLRLMRLLGDCLESYLDGDETALETLGESLEQAGFTADDLHSAILVLRSLAAGIASGAEPVTAERAPAKNAQRVPSAEERESLSPEAWGFLIDLKRRGSLNHEQFERVLDLLSGCGVRPIGVELVREVATRVALRVEPREGSGEAHHGDFDLVH